jgi:hypothetical protein
MSKILAFRALIPRKSGALKGKLKMAKLLHDDEKAAITFGKAVRTVSDRTHAEVGLIPLP